MFKSVIVGVDGNDGGRDAIALAEKLIDPAGELTLAYVYWGETHPWRGSSAAYDAAERDRARELLEKAREDAGTEAQLRWRGSTSIGRGLHELAEAIGSDLLVIGCPSSGLLGRIHVAESIRDALNGAPCAVAFAPPATASSRSRCVRSASDTTPRPRASTRSASRERSPPNTTPSSPPSRRSRSPHM